MLHGDPPKNRNLRSWVSDSERTGSTPVRPGGRYPRFGGAQQICQDLSPGRVCDIITNWRSASPRFLRSDTAAACCSRPVTLAPFGQDIIT